MKAHLDHLEELILLEGVEGGKRAIKILKEMGNLLSGNGGPSPLVTTKWDGAPAIICGTDPADGQFFVGTKSVFAVTAPKICKTQSDIQSMYDGVLANKLSDCLKYLKNAKIKGVLQGDLMFTSDKVNKTIKGKSYITFRPNTITYAADPKSKLGQDITRAKLGIVFHTKYTGQKLINQIIHQPDGSTREVGMKKSYNVNKGDYTETSQTWIQTAEYKDVSGAATFSKQELNKYNQAIKRAEGSLAKAGSILNQIQSGKKTLQIDTELLKFFNQYVKKGSSIPFVAVVYTDFMKHMGQEYDKVISKNKTLKAQADKAVKFKDAINFIEKNKRQFLDMFHSYKDIQLAKMMLVNKMKNISSLKLFVDMGNGDYKATTPEGFVCISEGQAVKLVDRLEFSKLNFTVPKQW